MPCPYARMHLHCNFVFILTKWFSLLASTVSVLYSTFGYRNGRGPCVAEVVDKFFDTCSSCRNFVVEGLVILNETTCFLIQQLCLRSDIVLILYYVNKKTNVLLVSS